MADADAVVIGAGPNGLAAANVLADAGWRVVVLEANAEPGGAVRSGALAAPGFVADWCSSCYPLGAASPVLRSFGLERHGVRWAHAPIPLAHPTPDGCAVIGADVDDTAASLDEYAAGDGDAWRGLYARWERLGDRLLDALLSPFPPVRAGARLAGAIGPLGLLGFGRFATMSVRRAAEEEFAGEGGRLLLAGNALHTDLTPEAATGSIFGWMLCGLAQQVGFPVVEGGAGRLTAALVDRLEGGGGTVLCDQRVVGIDVRRGRALAVRTADGELVSASRAVLADVAAPALFLDLVGEEHLPSRFVKALRRFEWDHATVKVDWALDGRIPWDAEPAGRASVVHLADSLADLSASAACLAAGVVPARPFLLVGQTTTADPTRSPAGTEAAWSYTHVPQRILDDAGGEVTGRWDAAEADRMADRMEAEVERRAPGFRARIRARHVFTPRSLEELDANLVGGAVNGGTAQLHQQLVFRPVPGLGRANTPVSGLFLASASAHPGGGVHGACGANAARAALAADRVRRLTRRGAS